MDISVVVPLYNEEESLPELFSWIERVMEANGFSYEVIFVNDGSTDRSWQVIEELKQQHPGRGEGHQVPPQLRQVARLVLRLRAS